MGLRESVCVLGGEGGLLGVSRLIMGRKSQGAATRTKIFLGHRSAAPPDWKKNILLDQNVNVLLKKFCQNKK